MVTQVNQLTITLYTKVFPFLSIFLTALFIYFIVFMPKSIKTMIKAWKSRGTGALMFIANDDGFVEVEWMNGDMGQGIFTGKDTKYMVTPRPRYISPVKVEKGEGNEHPLDELSEKDKAQMDGMIQKRHILAGIGKPVYFAYKGKSIGVTPSLLKAMEEAPEISEEETGERIRLLDARTIKTYIPFTFSPSFIDALTFKHEQIGFYSRPLDKIKQNAIPMGIVLIVIFVAYFLMTGKIKIPGLG